MDSSAVQSCFTVWPNIGKSSQGGHRKRSRWTLGIWEKAGGKRGSKSNILISKLLEQFCFWCSWQLSVSPEQQREALFQKRKAKGCAHYCAAAFLGKKQQTTNFFIKVVHNLGLSLDGSNFWTENSYTFHVLILLCSSWINELAV